jgi:hypothetical protein
MLTQAIHHPVCNKALLLVLGSVAVASVASLLIKPRPQADIQPPKDEIVHVTYSVDYVPTCSVPVNLMRPPGVDQCTGQARKPANGNELQSSIPLTFRK